MRFTLAYSPFTIVLSENVLCQGMVALLNPVCVLLSGMLHVLFIRAKYVLQFSRRDDLRNTVFHPAIARIITVIVWTYTFEAAGSKTEGSI